jgi:hypothetical protein
VKDWSVLPNCDNLILSLSFFLFRAEQLAIYPNLFWPFVLLEFNFYKAPLSD